MIQNPTNLGSSEISISIKTSLFSWNFSTTSWLFSCSQRCCLAWLPNDIAVDRMSSVFIPENRFVSRWLIPDCPSIICGFTTFDESTRNNWLWTVPNFSLVLCYPIPARENLGKLSFWLELSFSFFVENDVARELVVLVNGYDVFFLWHMYSSWYKDLEVSSLLTLVYKIKRFLVYQLFLIFKKMWGDCVNFTKKT